MRKSQLLFVTLSSRHFLVSEGLHPTITLRQHQRNRLPSSICRLFQQPSSSSSSSSSFLLDENKLLQEKQQAKLIERGRIEQELMFTTSSILKSPTGTIETSSGGDRYDVYVNALRQDGVVRLDNVLSTETARQLREHVLGQVDVDVDANTDTSTGYAIRNKNSVEKKGVTAASSSIHSPQFAKVLLNHQRWDLLLNIDRIATENNDGDDDSIVRKALREVFQSPMRPILDEMLGDPNKAALHELATLVSKHGSHRQNVHPDHAHDPNNSNTNNDRNQEEHPLCLTCFVALQDITPDMGPTVWIPTTHRREAHTQFQRKRVEDPFDPLSPKDQLLSTTPSVVGLLPAGSCAIFDSRILHCGTAHTDPNPSSARALFYVTFQHAANNNNDNGSSSTSVGKETGSLLDTLRAKKHTLASLSKELQQ